MNLLGNEHLNFNTNNCYMLPILTCITAIIILTSTTVTCQYSNQNFKEFTKCNKHPMKAREYNGWGCYKPNN